MKNKGIMSGLLILGTALTMSNVLVAYYDDDRGERVFTGGILGGITGAAIGGAAGGGTGAAVGGAAGFGLGAIIGGSTTRRHRDPQYKLDRLYSKRDKLTRRFSQAKSERKRARLQRSLDRVNADIRDYERSYGIQPRSTVQHRYGVRAG